MLIQYKQHAYDLTTAPLMAELCCQTPPLNSGAGLNLVTKSRYYHCPISTSLYRYKNSSRLVSCYQFYITKKGNVCFKSFSKKQMNKKMVYYL